MVIHMVFAMFNWSFFLQTRLVTWQSMSYFLGQSLNHSLIAIFIPLVKFQRPHHDLTPNGGWVKGNPLISGKPGEIL